MKKYKKIILLMFLELIIVAGSIYALNTSLTNTKDNQNTKIIAESSDVKTVEVYVAGWDTDSGKVFSDEMLELLNVNTFSYLYWFPAGTIQVDLSKLSSATGSYSNSDEDWSYILECLKSLDTSALIGGYSEANANNDIVNYIDEIILDKGYTDGYYSKLKTAISETDNYPTSNHDNLHLDIRFNTITVSYYYSDNVQDTKIFIKGTTLAEVPKTDAPSNTIIAGYYTDENYTNEWDPSGVPLDESLTVYVKLINAIDVIINYEVGVGNGYVTNPQDSDDLIQSTYENFDYQIGSPKGSYAVSKDGYVFAGWYLDKDCTESVPSSSVIDNKITPAEDVWTSGYEVTYYAKFIKENSVIIRTIDSSTSDALKGAVFLLYKIDSGNTLYYSISESSVNWISNSKGTLLSTDSSGNIEVSLTNGTYYLQETIAPTNYELYEDVITFTVNENGSVTVNQLDYVSANSNELIVQNNILKLLPSTDGLDRIVYIIVGLILCLGASVFFIKNTKKKDFG